MYRNHAVAAVVAARNEAPFIDDVVDAMPAFVDRIYVVDDASRTTPVPSRSVPPQGHPRTSPRSGAPSGAGSTAESPRPIRRVGWPCSRTMSNAALAAPSKRATSPRSTAMRISLRPSTATDRWTRAASIGSSTRWSTATPITRKGPGSAVANTRRECPRSASLEIGY